MEENGIVAITITSVIAFIIIVLSIVLLFGKGSFLISGYNTMPRWKKEKYNVKALSRFVGGILLPIGIMTPFVAVGAIYNIRWISIAYPIVVLLLIAFAVIFANTGRRFRK